MQIKKIAALASIATLTFSSLPVAASGNWSYPTGLGTMPVIDADDTSDISEFNFPTGDISTPNPPQFIELTEDQVQALITGMDTAVIDAQMLWAFDMLECGVIDETPTTIYGKQTEEGIAHTENNFVETNIDCILTKESAPLLFDSIVYGESLYNVKAAGKTMQINSEAEKQIVLSVAGVDGVLKVSAGGEITYLPNQSADKSNLVFTAQGSAAYTPVIAQ